MLIATKTLLQEAEAGGYAVGAFNVYNLEGTKAVVAAAEAGRSPAILQIHLSALRHGGPALIALCLAAAREATVPMAVHLDHSNSAADIRAALAGGLNSVMADGSHLAYDDNIAFTQTMTALVHAQEGTVEAELGRLTGTEDGLTVAEYEGKLTDPDQASDFVTQTGIDALAVCIGNVHGAYRSEPRLDFDRLAAIRERVSVPLVLHGTSGLPEAMVRRSVELGVCKFNVNTEVREAYLKTLKERLTQPEAPELVDLMGAATTAMQAVIAAKLDLFGSVGRVRS